MRKFIVYGLLSIVFALTIHHTPYTIHQVLAADSTPSADIQAKLDELKKEIASKAASLKQDLDQKLQNKAYVGEVKTHSQTSLTLGSETGPKLVNINQDTDFESNIKTKKSFSGATVADGDFVGALGDIDETQVLTARKLVLLAKPKPSQKIFLWGKVVSSDGKLTTVTDRNAKNIAISLPKDTSVDIGNFIIATGELNENDIFEAEFVHVIDQGFLRGKKVPAQTATPSATPKSAKTASPSAKTK